MGRGRCVGVSLAVQAGGPVLVFNDVFVPWVTGILPGKRVLTVCATLGSYRVAQGDSMG